MVFLWIPVASTTWIANTANIFCSLCILARICSASGNLASFKIHFRSLSYLGLRHETDFRVLFLPVSSITTLELRLVQSGFFSAGKRNRWLLLWWTTYTCKFWRCLNHPTCKELMLSMLIRKGCVRLFYMENKGLCMQNLTPLKTMVEELVWQNMQNQFDCFCFPVIPLNLTNCLNIMNF